MPRGRIRAAYITCVPLFPRTNGGALCCRNHVRRLAEDPAVELLACSFGPPEDEDANRSAVEALGTSLTYLPFGSDAPERLRARSSGRLARRWPFHHETVALTQPEIDGEAAAWVARSAPDVVIVDYVPTAVYAPSLYAMPVPRVTITLNREGVFYRGLRRAGTVPPDASPTWFANVRMQRFEAWVHAHTDALVALTAHDLPRGPRRPPICAVMPPAFDSSARQWQHRGSESLFFVGNVGHYPNLVAVEWLCTRLAPELASIRNGATIRIIGASAESVPADWRHPNVVFLGVADEEAVEEEFASVDLFIAPIKNSLGSKMKLTQCVTHSTPFVATPEAMSGLPFRGDLPVLDLADPRGAATLAAGLMGNPDRLVQSSEHVRASLAAHLESQVGRWGHLLGEVCDRSPAPTG